MAATARRQFSAWECCTFRCRPSLEIIAGVDGFHPKRAHRGGWVGKYVDMSSQVSERNTAIVAAVGRGVPLRTVCAVYDLDASTVRSALEAAGQAMPVQYQGPDVLIGPRQAEMLRRAMGGEDFTVIGRSFDLTRERVRQIVKEHTGLSAKDLHAAREAARQQFREQRVRDLASMDLDCTLNELATQSGLSIGDVETVLGPAEAARRRPARTLSGSASPAQVLNDLRRVAAMTGGTPLSGPFYDKHREGGVSSQRVAQIFGTWSSACEQAGIDAHRPARTNYTQGWTREECLRWVFRYLRSSGDRTHSGYDTWARGQREAPSAGTARNRCGGSWITIIRDAYAMGAGEPLSPIGGAIDGGSDSDLAIDGMLTPIVLARKGEAFGANAAKSDGPRSSSVPTDLRVVPEPVLGTHEQTDEVDRLEVESISREHLAESLETALPTRPTNALGGPAGNVDLVLETPGSVTEPSGGGGSALPVALSDSEPPMSSAEVIRPEVAAPAEPTSHLRLDAGTLPMTKRALDNYTRAHGVDDDEAECDLRQILADFLTLTTSRPVRHVDRGHRLRHEGFEVVVTPDRFVSYASVRVDANTWADLRESWIAQDETSLSTGPSHSVPDPASTRADYEEERRAAPVSETRPTGTANVGVDRGTTESLDEGPRSPQRQPRPDIARLLVEQLERLAALYASGALTADEFTAAKARVLDLHG